MEIINERGINWIMGQSVSFNQASWMKGAVYLSLAALIAKGLSAMYKIPYQNITGDTGFYVYQQVYPLYGAAFVLGTYGFPLVIARMIAQNTSSEVKEGLVPVERLTFIFLCLVCFHSLLGTLIIILAEPIAALMGDPGLAGAIGWMGAPFFLIPFLAMGRGLYQGIGHTAPAAVSQVTEQLVRVIIILAVAVWAMQQGDPYLAGVSAGAGAFIGGLAGIIISAVMGWKYRRIFIYKNTRLQLLSVNWRKDLKELLVSGIFVSISAMALVIFQLADAFTVFRQLEIGGWSTAAAAAEKGIYDRGWPLVQFGAVITTVFSYAAIPLLSRAYEQKQMDTVRQEVGRSVKLCLVFGGAAAAGMAAIMPSLNEMMFMNQKGSGVLQIFSFPVLFGSLFMTAAALLHAAGKSRLAVYILMAGLSVKTLLNLWLVPVYGIMGAAVSTTVSFAIIALMSLAALVRHSFWLPLPFLFWMKWLVSLAGMAVVVNVYLWVFTSFSSDGRGAETMKSVTASAAGAFVFIWLIWKLRLFSKDEWEALPKLGRLIPYSGKYHSEKRRRNS
ncbi:putative polysaccharide biosynthesis protein [Salipaludibacillus aurantiacus]|nr:polysaccharide biosynthesis protein [Salipaludibacillus aurantiacus]